MQMQHIDNGFYRISEDNARSLAGKLPDHGAERLVVHKGQHYWLGRTTVGGKLVWSIRTTRWRLVTGVATLGG